MTVAAATFNTRRQRFSGVTEEPDEVLPPLPPIVHTNSTSSLYEAVKPIYHLVANLKNKVTYALEECKNPKDDLTCDESAAIYLYTLQWPEGQHSFFTMFNRALRNENRTQLIPYYNYLNLFMLAMNKLPAVEDRVWRGENIDLKVKYKQGTTHVWWGVSSCTDMVHVTGDFLVNQTKKRTLFNIKCYDGKIIKNHSAYPNESETILPPGAYLKVKSSLDFTENLCIVDIEQIPPAPEEVAHSAGDADTPGTLSYSNSSQISDVHILWLDPNVNKSQENVKTQEKLKELYPSYYKSFEKYDELEKFIEQKQSCGVVLVTGGQIGSQIVPKIHDLLQSISLIVYCMDKEKNEKWSRNYTKVKAVVNRSDDMIKQVKKEYAQLVEEQKQQQQVTESKSSRFSDFQQEAAKLLTPLTGYQNQPLVSLEESLAPVMDIISDLPKYIWKAKYNCTPPADGLTPDESASIRIYSMEFNAPEGSLYSLLNQDLRSASRHAIKKWFLYLKLFFHALFKLPSIEGTVWRALPGNASIDYEIGKQFIWWGVSSTARNMSILNGYINSKHGQNTLFCIQCKNGKSIRNHSYFTEVDEILLMPGTNLEVMGQLEPAEGLRIINLKELDRPLFFQ